MNVPPPPMPPYYTMPQAIQALGAEPKEFTISVDGEPTTILGLYNRLVKGPAPTAEVYISHPDAWRMSFSKDPESDTWYIDRSSPLSSYGVLTRTYGTISYEIPPEDIYEIWEFIVERFPMAWPAYLAEKVKNNLKQKAYARRLLRLSKHKDLPENLDPLLESYFSSHPRPYGWAEPKANLGRINTSLFHINEFDPTLFTNNNNNLRTNPYTNFKKINTRLFTQNNLRKAKKSKRTKTRKN